ncbi:NAD-dependent epimerase/dehydratase family protein [Mesonia sp. MT50]|uniref:NAD-dependent epimerase/dehydratase family protein n=1 Tax=Mesonia profundi TaxID=3070998 RepID=A0ABU0ZXR7_9FLAO|nr:NAD-dependent epimerase/dehydratase family protein [Mesonia profundi]MDQ7916246.1 NAD-dependent epimerase/dehydratase family protein [Mesonia profundi]
MILVSGATGLVGSHLLAQLLDLDQPIRAIYRQEKKVTYTKELLLSCYPKLTSSQWSRIEWVEAHLEDIPQLSDAFQGVQEVYHCAGYVSYNSSDKEYKKLRKINIEGTSNMVNLALSHSVKKFCHVSSIATLGSELKQKIVDEESPRNHENKFDNYSITKYGGEMEVWRASQEGLNVVIVNPGVIIGVGFWETGSGLLFSKIKKGLRYYIPLVTGFVDVRDVAKAMILLMHSSIKQERFILVSESISFKEVLQQIAKEMGCTPPKKRLQPWMVKIGWIFQWLGRILFGTNQEITKLSIKAAFNTTVYSSAKIEKSLNFKFNPIKKTITRVGRNYVENEA